MDEWQILTLLVLNALCMSNEMQQRRASQMGAICGWGDAAG